MEPPNADGGKVRVVIEGINTQAGFKQGCLVPGCFTVGDVRKYIRKLRELRPDEMIVIFRDSHVMKASTPVAQLQAESSESDSSVHLQYDFVKSYGLQG